MRVTAIYEGTNGIQAMDMVGRKLADGGAAAQTLIEAVEETARQAAGDLGARLAAAARRLAEATGWMAAAEPNDRFAGAVPYLRAFALTLGGHYLLKAAAAEAEDGPRAALAAFHIRQLLPQVPALCDAACEGAAPLYAARPGSLIVTIRRWLRSNPGRWVHSGNELGGRDRRGRALDAAAAAVPPGPPQRLCARRRRRLDDRRHRPRHAGPRGLGGAARRAARRRPVRRVILTHHHPDHVGLAGWFQTGRRALDTRTAWLRRGC